MLVFGLLVGVVNGLVTTLLKVPSFITTLGMMLVLFGAIRLWTGGAPTGALTEAFRQPGRGGIDAGAAGLVPWALFVMLVVGALAVLLMRSPFGRTLLAVGDNPVAAVVQRRPRRCSCAPARSCCPACSPPLAAVLIGGYAGVTAQVGTGLEFVAITAVVLGGVALGGGQGLRHRGDGWRPRPRGAVHAVQPARPAVDGAARRAGRDHHRRRRPGGTAAQRRPQTLPTGHGTRPDLARPGAHRVAHLRRAAPDPLSPTKH